MPNYNNEGFAIASSGQCVGGRKPVYWANDGEDLGVAIRSGNLPCTAFSIAPPPVIPEFPVAPLSVLAGLLAMGAVVFSHRGRAPVRSPSR